MVRDDQEAAMLLWEWRTKHDLLLNALNVAKKNEEIATISGVQLEFGPGVIDDLGETNLSIIVIAQSNDIAIPLR